MIKQLDINHPIVSWAKKAANRDRVPYCIMPSALGGYTLKKVSNVSPYIDSMILAEIHPDYYFDVVQDAITPVFKYSKVSI